MHSFPYEVLGLPLTLYVRLCFGFSGLRSLPLSPRGHMGGPVTLLMLGPKARFPREGFLLFSPCRTLKAQSLPSHILPKTAYAGFLVFLVEICAAQLA